MLWENRDGKISYGAKHLKTERMKRVIPLISGETDLPTFRQDSALGLGIKPSLFNLLKIRPFILFPVLKGGFLGLRGCLQHLHTIRVEQGRVSSSYRKKLPEA